MLLMELPTEILARIFELVGSLFLLQDLNNLTISKRWHALAEYQIHLHPVLQGPATIGRLWEGFAMHGGLLPRLPEWTARTLSLHLIYDNEKRARQDGRALEAHRTLHLMAGSVSWGFHVPPVVTLLEQLPCLRSLKIDLSIAKCFTPADRPRYNWEGCFDGWCIWAPRRLALQLAEVHLPNLRELELRIAGSRETRRRIAERNNDDYEQRQNNGQWLNDPNWRNVKEWEHTCVAINGLINNFQGLQTLVLRLASVCPRLFARNLAEGHQLSIENLCVQLDVGEDDRDFIKSYDCTNGEALDIFDSAPDVMSDIEEVKAAHIFRGAAGIIGDTVEARALDIFGDAPHIIGDTEARALRANSRLFDVAHDLAKSAKDYARALKAPKYLRVLWPDMRSEVLSKNRQDDKPRRFAMDVLTGQIFALGKSEAWDNKGQAVPLDVIRSSFGESKQLEGFLNESSH